MRHDRQLIGLGKRDQPAEKAATIPDAMQPAKPTLEQRFADRLASNPSRIKRVQHPS